MVPLRSPERVTTQTRTQAHVDPALVPLLNQIRLCALTCRAAARQELFTACALLSSNPAVSSDAHLNALMRCLGQVMSSPPLIFRPGSYEISFDEAWLLRLVSAWQQKDGDSFGFLIRSRVSHVGRRNVAFLIARISDQFSKD